MKTHKNAIIFDLDNTIFPVSSIGSELFYPLFQLISKNDEFEGNIDSIKKDIMRKPFQKVASEYNFSKNLTNNGNALLKELTYEKKIFPFKDYPEIKKIPGTKFLVTTGFTKMQKSKIKQLGIQNDFDEIHIIDPIISDLTKKEVFSDILKRHNYKTPDILVVGDDPHSEIQAAMELGIETALYHKNNTPPEGSFSITISDFKQLRDMFNKK